MAQLVEEAAEPERNAAPVRRRAVFHVGGYDPLPPETAHRRFARELKRFEPTWSVRAESSPPAVAPGLATWTVETHGPNWRTVATVAWARWDRIMAAYAARRTPLRIVAGLAAIADFCVSGALWGYLRTNWRYALFTLYPFLVFAGFALAGGLVGLAARALSGSGLAGAIAGAAAFAGLCLVLVRRLLLAHLCDDWTFSRRWVRDGGRETDEELRPVVDALARALVDPAVDEVVVIGHSLGAAIAVNLLDKALASVAGPATRPVALVTVGSSILKLGFHRRAEALKQAVGRIASDRRVTWVEYQALTDVMNFYKSDPVRELGTSGPSPILRTVRFSRMLDPDAYRRIRRNFFRLHSQFVSGNTRRAAYDYFMTVCGPLPVERLARSPDGAGSAIGEDGSLLEGQAVESEGRAG